jgi:NhaP-type Na+/H+ or K+/H+ antiporter
MKFVIMVFLGIALPFFSHYTRFEESKYIGIIFFGYFSYQVWGEDKPDKELAKFWVLCQPFLFSSVGASILIDSIKPNVFGYSILILILGVGARWIGTFLVTGGDQGFTIKERMFFAFSWIPKATVQAAIGGIVLDTAKNLPGIEDDVRE